MRWDALEQLQDYRGILGWYAAQSDVNFLLPPIEVPIYIKSATPPVRKPKITEINTVAQEVGGIRFGTNTYFEGAPDPLQTVLDGWIITPYVSKIWLTTDIYGRALPNNIGNLNWVEIITAFIEGRMRNPVNLEYVDRRDPDYYISPYGAQYINPIILNWQPQASPVPHRQQFSMTLQLET